MLLLPDRERVEGMAADAARARKATKMMVLMLADIFILPIETTVRGLTRCWSCDAVER